MMTQVDELSMEAHTQMTLVEFLEAVARIADKCSFSNIVTFQNEKRESLKPPIEHGPSIPRRRKKFTKVRLEQMRLKKEQKHLAHKIMIFSQKMGTYALSNEYGERFCRRRPLVKDLRKMNEESEKEASEEEDLMSETSSD
jgi:hypothetical protein